MLERMQVADVARVYELCNAVAASANDGDLERWISFWIEGAIQMPPGAPCRVGRQQIRREMHLLFEGFDTRRMTIQPEEVRILGDWAYAHGTYAFERMPQEETAAGRHSGKFLVVLQKQADGSWKIAIACHNSDTPPGQAGGYLPSGGTSACAAYREKGARKQETSEQAS